MPRTRVTIGICHTANGQASTRTFDRSPVLIGRGPWNDLSLESLAVAPLHGEIWFGPGFLAYLNLTARNLTMLDGRPLRSGELVRLNGRPLIAIGPYHIDAIGHPPGDRHQEDSAETMASAAYVTRALAIMANFAGPLLELRRHLLPAPAAGSLDPNDPYEIVRSLLASSTSAAPDPRRPSDA